MRALCGILALVATGALGGCGGRPAPLGGWDDGGSGDGVVLDFCQGQARAEVNGAAMPVQASGEMMYLDCCEAAGVVFAPLGAGHRIFVSWRHAGGPSPISPVTLDLADPALQWGVSITVDCDTTTGCSSWTGTLQGTLTIATLDEYQYPAYGMTLCLEGVEDPAAPHATVHSMRLWAPDVVAEVDLR
ncbi:MAG: hypothetical protein HY906_03425 [Deltaproteobacteria bacterium]|nr:hypothetical protein [Deltaproteobacteria bacterium]